MLTDDYLLIVDVLRNGPDLGMHEKIALEHLVGLVRLKTPTEIEAHDARIKVARLDATLVGMTQSAARLLAQGHPDAHPILMCIVAMEIAMGCKVKPEMAARLTRETRAAISAMTGEKL